VSRATVRAALASFVAGANITGLSKVYQAKPTFFSGEQLNLASDNGAAAFAWIDLGDSSEERWSVPAQWPGQSGAGDKAVHYEAAIVVQYQYEIPQQVTPAVSPDAWVVVEDAIIQAIKDRLHSDPALGNAGVVLSSGQFRGDMRVTGDEPILESGKVISTRAIEIRITEVIQA
jgi:hypothetical protein